MATGASGARFCPEFGFVAMIPPPPSRQRALLVRCPHPPFRRRLPCRMILPRARKVRQRAPWLLLLWAAASAHAAQVSGVQVTRDGTRFRIDMRIAIEEPPPAVFRALQDDSAMARFNPDLRAVRVQPTAEPGRVRLFTTVHTCVLIFCKLMHQEEIMTATASTDGGTLHADLVSGDFKGGYGQWVVEAVRGTGA